MKSKYITHLIFEGVDGVGKSVLSYSVWKKYNYTYRTYVRGEMSDYVYAKKYKRQFFRTQNNCPFLHVLLTASDEHIKRNIMKRDFDNELTMKEELAKIKDKKLFLDAAKVMSYTHHIIIVDVTDLSVKEATDKIYDECEKYINSLSVDSSINEFNKLYEKGCDKVGINFKVRGNQPFFDNKMIMADAYLHNGYFETFGKQESCMHNFIFSLGYNEAAIEDSPFFQKTIDFCYPINSKILQRPEVYEYFSAINLGEKTILTTDSEHTPSTPNVIKMKKTFGEDYINILQEAKATIYTARELADMKAMTVRVYEAILANQIVFVDKQSDPKCEILKSIYGGSADLIDLLYVTPETIVQNYNRICDDYRLVGTILTNQRFWFDSMKEVMLNEENDDEI